MKLNLLNKNHIFTFWEPKDKIPSYLELCLETWKKFLPSYEIIILDYSNIFDWIEEDLFDEILFKEFSLPKQADAIRCAILKKYGGIWMDIDTIITSTSVEDILNINSELIMIGTHLAFIKADKNSRIIKYWHKNTLKNICFYKQHKCQKNKFLYFLEKIFNYKLHKNLESWNYLGNLILKKKLKTKNKQKFYSLDKLKINALPELKNKSSDSLIENYQNFYFKDNYSDDILKESKGIILLHNSWTLDKIKKLSKKEFLNLDCTLSKIFNKIL